MGCAPRRGAGRSPHGWRARRRHRELGERPRRPHPHPVAHWASLVVSGARLPTGHVGWWGVVAHWAVRVEWRTWLPIGRFGWWGRGCPLGSRGRAGRLVARWGVAVERGGWLPAGHRWLCGDPGCPLGGRRAHGEPVEHLESCRRRRCRRALHRSPAPPVKRGGARRLFPLDGEARHPLVPGSTRCATPGARRPLPGRSRPAAAATASSELGPVRAEVAPPQRSWLHSAGRADLSGVSGPQPASVTNPSPLVPYRRARTP